MVRLKVISFLPSCSHIPKFQFHNGSIKSLVSALAAVCPIYCFNSTMVRLKGLGVAIAGSLLAVFQFHNGSIKRAVCLAGIINDDRFNSTMVRLKGIPGSIDTAPRQRFNSTMVRLKGNVTGKHGINHAGFQFHNGSIKR